jgi:mono/diheme cytochrome c family protein
MTRQRGDGHPHARVAVAIATGLLFSACRPNMLQQPRLDPFEPSPVFTDQSSARPPVPGTIARGQLRVGPERRTGMLNGEPLTQIPMPITLDLLRRGRDRFDIYCAPCHSRTGDGDGMVVRRGFKQPPSYFEPRLLDAPAGHFFDVITNGIGAMPRYGYLISSDDRWAIVAYVRALQRSVENVAAAGTAASPPPASPPAGRP